MHQLVIIGREGVVNDPIRDPDQLTAVTGSLEAIARLNHADIGVALLSRIPATDDNESTISEMNAIHARLQQLLSRTGGHVDGLFIASSQDCIENEETLGEIGERFSIDPQQITVISDDTSLLLAAGQRGSACLQIGNPGKSSGTDTPEMPIHFPSLAAAVQQMLKS